jgi:hypothetical protein
MTKAGTSSVLAYGTVYSKGKDFCPFSTPPLEAYTSILGEKGMERLQKVATVAFFLHIPFPFFEAWKHGLGTGESRYILIE